MMNVEVRLGNIVYEPTNVMMIVTDSGCTRQPQVHRQIDLNAFGRYHAILRRTLDDIAATIVVIPNQNVQMDKFDNVMFVIDDADEALDRVIVRGLAKASQSGHQTVVMSLPRYNASVDDDAQCEAALASLVAAIETQRLDPKNTIETLAISVDFDRFLVNRAKEVLGV